MSVLEVLSYPDPRLRLKAKPVTAFDQKLKTLVDDLFETLYVSENCAGYAATQMNIQQQIIVIDFSARKNEPLCLINPKILAQDGERYESEGCMSVPEIYAKVKRAAWVKIEAQDIHGEKFELETDGFLASCIQHEIDHLNGILFIDRLSKLNRQKIEKALSNMR